jgi:hypothetical protein
MSLKRWWYRHPRWRMFLWGFCNPLFPPPWWPDEKRAPHVRPVIERFNRQAQEQR